MPIEDKALSDQITYSIAHFSVNKDKEYMDCEVDWLYWNILENVQKESEELKAVNSHIKVQASDHRTPLAVFCKTVTVIDLL